MWLWPPFKMVQEKQVTKLHLAVYMVHCLTRALVEVFGAIAIYEPGMWCWKKSKGFGKRVLLLVVSEGSLLFPY